MRTLVRRSAAGAALVVGAVLVAGCGNQPVGEAAAAATVSEAAATGSAAPSTDELRDALLPASAFGSGATVVGLTLEQVGELPGLAGLPENATVAPPVCSAGLSAMSTLGEDLPTLVAEGAYTTEVQSLEVLADGPALDGLTLPVDELLAGCSTITLTGPDGTPTTIALAALDVPALGDDAAGLTVTVTGPEDDVSVLVGVVSQGSRALLLAQTGDAPDEAAFIDLLTKAADAAS